MLSQPSYSKLVEILNSNGTAFANNTAKKAVKAANLPAYIKSDSTQLFDAYLQWYLSKLASESCSLCKLNKRTRITDAYVRYAGKCGDTDIQNYNILPLATIKRYVKDISKDQGCQLTYSALELLKYLSEKVLIELIKKLIDHSLSKKGLGIINSQSFARYLGGEKSY